MQEGIAILEVTALGASLVIIDHIEKAAPVRLLQAEFNDYYGIVIKVGGPPAALAAAIAAADQLARRMHVSCVSTRLLAPHEQARPAILSRPEFSPLLQRNVVLVPRDHSADTIPPTETSMVTPDEKRPAAFAIGLIETQGFTAVLEAVDTACKAADVEVIAKEKLGGGYITILVKGDVAAVHAAVEAGKQRVEGLGKLIAAHVIARPSEAVLRLLTPL